jgi:hypothetical protein
LQNDIAANNGTNGVKVSGTAARVSISDVDAFGNSNLGTQAVSGGTLASFGNNRITDNNKGFTAISIVPGSGPEGATRTWVSGVGDDAQSGSRIAPCKTFAGVISKTAAGGEIDVLDPNGCGTVTITRAVTLDGSGSFGSILAPGTNAIVIAAQATDVVVIRGLSLQGLQAPSSVGPGLNGIRILSAAAVFIENCNIQNFSQAGIDFEPTIAGCQLFVENTTVSNCGGGGVLIKPGAANARAMVDQVFSQFNQFGFAIRDLADVTITNSLANGDRGNGFRVQSATAAAFMNLESDSSSNNGGSGIVAQGVTGIAATANLSRVTVLRNTGRGLAEITNGLINSFGNIEVGDNVGGDGAPTGTLSQS